MGNLSDNVSFPNGSTLKNSDVQYIDALKRLDGPIASGTAIMEMIPSSPFQLDEEHVAEFLKILEAENPGTIEEQEPLMVLCEQFRLLIPRDEHMRAVQAQCEVATEVYGGVLALVAMHNGLAAEGLCRTLFELLISTTHLAENPAKLQDFIDYGKLVNYRLMRKIKPVLAIFQERQQKSIAATQAEYEQLEKKFKPRKARVTESWHGEKVTTLIDKSGMTDHMYHVYYKKSSNIAHGTPYSVIQRKDNLGTSWGIGIDSKPGPFMSEPRM